MCTSLLPCPLCSLPRFNNLESLRVGLIKVATENLKCPICSEIFMGLDKLTIHLFSHSQNSIFKPDDCVPNENENDALENNLDIGTDKFQNQVAFNKKIASRLKPTNTSTDFNLVDEPHYLQSTNKVMPLFNINTIPFIGIPENLSTQRCKKNEKKVLDKTKNRNNKLSEKCDICGFCFLGKNILEMHKKLIHNVQNSEIINGVSKYCCHVCSKVFKMRGSLMVHLRMVHFDIVPSVDREEEQPQCHARPANTCDIQKDAPINNEVINTEGAKHDSEILITNGKAHDTDNCPVNTATSTSKQWTCDICKKQFTTKYFLKKHKRLHTGEMPYSCIQCNKTFTFQQSYHKHLLYHNDDKPHQCSHCGRAFKELSTLHNHQRIHTGEKPFSCETCGKCFRQRVSYLVHRRIHTGAMPYKCTSCEKSFRYKVSQRTHKCTAQPPGTLVRQSGDLVQKLIRNQKEPKYLPSNTTKPIENVDHELLKQKIKYSHHFDFDLNLNSEKNIQNNTFLKAIGHNTENHLTDDLICDELRPRDIRQTEEKNVIDELVNESILKMDFSHPATSTSREFNSGVTDLYSMMSPLTDMEDNLPSPSEKLKNLTLSSSSESTAEGYSNGVGAYDQVGGSQIYRVPYSSSIDNMVIIRKSEANFTLNDPQLYETIYQKR